MKRTIGVLITYYNEKELLTEFLESLLKQTCQVDEILIYDDASTAAAEQYLPLRCPAKVIRGSINRGPSYGRNILLQESQSDYIHFQDADDLFHPDWCLRVSQAIEATQAEWILTEISSYQNGELACERVLELNKRTGVTDWVRQAIQGAILVPAGTYLRSKIQVIGGYRKDLWQSEDYDFHVRLAATDPSIAVIDEPLI
ncbi:MAG: glycosyltransferase family 2 protein, partial [Acidobacteria bacterium]|nr:glycosyltransferase family 2 protein [Acidobacteriota bacterium]